ncbi:hypothetical protein [Nostoc sp.]|uniref:hypothetical protein n=1 Tax=Nostoc sp. TaxID=1180 RepID=UPI002FF9FB76
MNKIEYLILSAAVKDYETLRNVASDWQLSHTQLASLANCLFQNGDILAGFPIEDGKSIKDITLTMSQIQAHLDGKLDIFYYLTPQGGTKWEAISNVDWNRYYRGKFGYNYDVTTKLYDAEVISRSKNLIDNYLKSSEYLDGYVHLPETVVWEKLESWQATYWKTLLQAYKVRYKYRNVQRSINLNDRQEWELDIQIKNLFAEMQQWYTEPNFKETPPNPMDYEEFGFHTLPDQTAIQKIEYLILESAVIFKSYSLEFVANSKKLSHTEIVIGADILFQRGDIRARVFADEHDFEGISNIILTKAGIQDHLDGRIKASYYLTPQGGARWEEMAHPDWNKFLIVNILEIFPYEHGILGTQREIIEKLLVLDKFILMREHVPGTEVWEVVEPWQATYWKTLPLGYHVCCEFKDNDWDYCGLDDHIPTDLLEPYEQALQWYKDVKKWYINPY